MIQTQAVFVAIGIDRDGRRQVLGVELSNRESRSSWATFVTGLKARGLHGVEFVGEFRTRYEEHVGPFPLAWT